jgi:hypothetical protein
VLGQLRDRNPVSVGRRWGNGDGTGKFVARPLTAGMKAVNRSIAQLRAPGEWATELKNWRILRVDTNS